VTGFGVCRTAWANSACLPGRPIVARLAASPLIAATCGRPRPDHLATRIGQRAYERDALCPGIKRQGAALVLEEHHGASRGRPGGHAPPVAYRGRFRRTNGAAVRVIEQPQPVLELQDPRYRSIHFIDGHEASLQRFGQTFLIGIGHHVDVDARPQRQRGSLRKIGRHAVGDEFGYCVVIAHENPVEAPLLAQDGLQKISVGRHRNSGEIIEGRHHRQDPGTERCPERWQVDFGKRAIRNVRRGIVASGDAGTVGNEMLGRCGDHGLDRTLKSADLGLGEARGDQRVFARTFRHSAPSWIARDVEHGREGQVEAGRRRFGRSVPCGLLPKRRIERARLGDRHREDRPEAMQHVEAEEERDPEARLLQRQALGRFGLPDPEQVEHAADPAFA